MLQARQLGRELYVGVHSDEEILKNKGPVVMKLKERIKAVDGCKWSTKSIPDAPYVTDPQVMKEYGCSYVVHGDDITTDANGNDCYQQVKDLGMFVVVKRTPNILTTDLVGRMLLMSKEHHLRRIASYESCYLRDLEYLPRFEAYASDETGLNKGPAVFINVDTEKALYTLVEPSQKNREAYKSIYYVDGGFDLFHPGHIEMLRLAKDEAEKHGASLVVGVHDDYVLNETKGLNYPIMNVFERSLCILLSRYVDGIVIGAPYVPSSAFLAKLPGTVKCILHGPTKVFNDAYDVVKKEGLYREIGKHEFDYINTELIVDRVLSNKKAYEERQRKKGWKASHEAELKRQEDARAS